LYIRHFPAVADIQPVIDKVVNAEFVA